MGHIQAFATLGDDTVYMAPSQTITPLESGAQVVEGLSDLPGAKDESENFNKATARRRGSSMREINVSKTNSTSVTLKIATHKEMALQVDLDLSGGIGEVSNGFVRPREQENLKPLRRSKKN